MVHGKRVLGNIKSLGTRLINNLGSVILMNKIIHSGMLERDILSCLYTKLKIYKYQKYASFRKN